VLFAVPPVVYFALDGGRIRGGEREAPTIAHQRRTASAPVERRWTLREATDFKRFPLYFVGPSFRELRLRGILRARSFANEHEPFSSDDVTFLYGNCPQFPCYPPLQVQTEHACFRNETSYAILPDRRLRLRGVQARFYEDGLRLELYTGRVTVVIYSTQTDRNLLLAASRHLESLDGTIMPGERLPRRVPAVLNSRSAVCRAIDETLS
jgi:hypothetical protein